MLSSTSVQYKGLSRPLHLPLDYLSVSKKKLLSMLLVFKVISIEPTYACIIHILI